MRLSRRVCRTLLLLLGLVLGTGLVGCGQKGDLYLPDKAGDFSQKRHPDQE